MILISHRGNLMGPNKKYENHPDYLNEALHSNFNIEIDLFYHESYLWLGHDKPQYKITDNEWLNDKRVWCHAKNIKTLNYLIKFKNIHCFFHQNDDVTLTSKGFIWTFPKKKVFSNSVIVIQEKIMKNQLPSCYGVCSDYVDVLK